MNRMEKILDLSVIKFPPSRLNLRVISCPYMTKMASKLLLSDPSFGVPQTSAGKIREGSDSKIEISFIVESFLASEC